MALPSAHPGLDGVGLGQREAQDQDGFALCPPRPGWRRAGAARGSGPGRLCPLPTQAWMAWGWGGERLRTRMALPSVHPGLDGVGLG